MPKIEFNTPTMAWEMESMQSGTAGVCKTEFSTSRMVAALGDTMTWQAEYIQFDTAALSKIYFKPP